MKTPTRITIALNEETSSLIEKMKKEMKTSQSKLVRQALTFYNNNKDFADASHLGSVREWTESDFI